MTLSHMFLFEETIKHRIALLLACLIVAVAQPPTRAQPSTPSEGPSLFVGHYGEIFEYSYGWMAEASMRAETEFVRLQPRPRKGEFTTLTDSAFTPENFTKKNLLELVVIPKDAPGGYRSLRDIHRAKEQEMSAHGVDYEIDEGESGDRKFDFPPGTFRVRIKSPYRLIQCYTESPKEFFILTYGDPQASINDEAAISGNIDTIEKSLSKYLAGVDPAKRPEIDLRGFRGFWRMWLFFNGPLFLLLLLPRSNSFLKRLNFIAYNLILFLNISGLIGFLIPCISYRTGWGTWQNGALLFATTAILGPWICRLIARRFYSPDEKRVFWWSWLAALPLVALDLEGYSSSTLPDPVSEIIFSSTFAFAMTGMAFGLIFALVVTLPDRNRAKTIAPLFLMLLMLVVCPVHARELSDSEILASTPAELARRMLREKKGDYDYRGEAVKKLKREGRYFDRQRVEITGLGSSDNTYKEYPSLFDDQIKPSFYADVKRLNLPWWKKIPRLLGNLIGMPAPKELQNVLMDINGNLSDKGKEVLKNYRGPDFRINEIVAHSWGSELIYNAIVSGYIKAPAKLIVVGVPDNYIAKWNILAAQTGTEVHFCKSKDDYVALWGGRLSKVTNSIADPWARKVVDQWATYRETHGVRKWDADPAIVEEIKTIPGLLGHDRLKYYDLLQKRGILKPNILDLSRRQGKAIDDEIELQKDTDLNDQYSRALNLIAEAKQRQTRVLAKERELMRAEPATITPLRPSIVPARAIPDRPPSGFNPPVLPQLKDFAITACRAPEQASIVYLNGPYNFSHKADDDRLAKNLAADLGDCPRRLFYELIAMIRYDRYGQIDRQWIRNMVAPYSRAPDRSPGYTPPLDGGDVPPTQSHDPVWKRVGPIIGR